MYRQRHNWLTARSMLLLFSRFLSVEVVQIKNKPHDVIYFTSLSVAVIINEDNVPPSLKIS